MSDYRMMDVCPTGCRLKGGMLTGCLLVGLLCCPMGLSGQSGTHSSFALLKGRTSVPSLPSVPSAPSASSLSMGSLFFMRAGASSSLGGDAFSDASSMNASASLDEACLFSGGAVSLTWEQAWAQLHRVSPAWRQSEQWVRMARAERVSLRSFWYPRLSAQGAYVHLSQPVEVRQSLKPYAQSLEQLLHPSLTSARPVSGAAMSPQSAVSPLAAHSSGISSASALGSLSCVPSLLSPLVTSWLAPSVTSLLDHLGSQTLSFPILGTNLTGVQVQLLWPLFTGGKRVFALRMGRRLVEVAEENRTGTDALLQVRLVTAYFGLQLAQRVTEVRRQALAGMERHDRQAERMEREGLLNKADRLFVQVACSEARREWESAVHQQEVALQALQVLLGLAPGTPICVQSPLFLNETLPPVTYFKQQAGVTNAAVRQLSLQETMASDRMKMGRGDYLPMVALFGRQTLYARNVPRSLVPRTWVGVGFTWDLFDGFRREAKVRRAACLRRSLREGRAQLMEELETGIDQLYASLQQAKADVTALQTSLDWSRELLRIRRQSFAEGMATSAEVVDAEVLQAKVEVAYLAAHYAYDVALATLLSQCGVPETFEAYAHCGRPCPTSVCFHESSSQSIQ